MITSKLFESSLFYIGPGYDVEPIRRLSHICQDFLYVNLFLDRYEVESWYSRWLKIVGFDIINVAVDDSFREETHLETYSGYLSDLVRGAILNADDGNNYLQSFQPAMHQSQFLIHFTLNKRSTGRIVNLYYMCAEGLSTYTLLSQNGKVAPKILCTIETKVLEFPDNLMNRFYENEDRARPLLWVRGFKPTEYPSERKQNNALDAIGVFSVPALDFNGIYTSGDWDNSGEPVDRRYCKGFMEPAKAHLLSNASFMDQYDTNPNHALVKEKLDPHSLSIGKNDIIVVPQRLVFLFEGRPCKVIGWTEIGAERWNWYRSAQQQVEKLASYVEEHSLDIETAHIIPACMEDEGQLYYSSIITLPFKTITYVPGIFDMVDMREDVLSIV